MKMPNNTLTAVISYIKTELSTLYEETEINSMTYIMLEHFFSISKKEVILEKEKRLSESELLQIIYAVKDLKKQKPLAYIFGEWLFYGLPLKVNQHTLIPRPETEELVQLVINENQSKKLRILDIGTGSGCIAIALKKQLPESTVTAFDVSEEALITAKQNALLNEVEVTFKQVNILNASSIVEQFDVIVSNPPYIPIKDKEMMSKNVLDFEPHLALFVENDNALLFYKAIAQFALTNLTKNGKLYLEIHENLGREVKSLFEKTGFETVKIINDMNGKNRIVSCLKKKF
jgi:release factor glutamine methyltransferase